MQVVANCVFRPIIECGRVAFGKVSLYKALKDRKISHASCLYELRYCLRVSRRG